MDKQLDQLHEMVTSSGGNRTNQRCTRQSIIPIQGRKLCSVAELCNKILKQISPIVLENCLSIVTNDNQIKTLGLNFTKVFFLTDICISVIIEGLHK